MEAIVVNTYGGPEVLEYVTIEKPRIKPHEVLIRVMATGVNFADTQARQGKYHGAEQPPFIPGLDAAGIIEEVGSAVHHLKVGQRVMAIVQKGSYAQYIAADAQLTYVLPDLVDFDTAAAAPVVSITSFKLLADVARIQAGETVLIHAAAGGVGTTATQLAKLLGARNVIGTVSHESKMETVLEAGADHVICYQNDDFVERVNELTNGNGADIILDSISGHIAERSIKCLASYGRLVTFGHAGGRPANIQTTDLHSSCRSVLGFSLGTTRNQRPHLLKETADQVLTLLADGKLKMKIGHRFSLKDAALAHKLIESRQSTGKILLDLR